MMMERAKTAPAPETTSTEHAKPPALAASSAPANASAEERVQDLERRLNLLDSGDGGVPSTPVTATTAPAAAAPAATKPPPSAKSQTGQNNPLLKRIQAAQERARLAERKEKETKAAAAAEVERRKREAEEAERLAAERERIAKAQSALRSVASRALEDKQKDKQNDILAQLEGKASSAAPPPAFAAAPPMPPAMDIPPPAFAQSAAAAATPGVPIMKSLDPPPPSFDSMKFPPPGGGGMRQQSPGGDGMIGHGMNSRALSEAKPPPATTVAPPPSFDFVERQLNTNSNDVPAPTEDFLAPPPPAPTAPAMSPSAPPMTMSSEAADHLHGIRPVAPPPFDPTMQAAPTRVDAMPPPPSFAEFEQHAPTSTLADGAADEEGFFEVDEHGNPLSLEQRQALLDEQRQLYESIMKEKASNDAAIARAQADAFDLRSSSAAARAMEGGGSSAAAATAGRTDAQAQAMRSMDAAGFDVAGGDAGAAASAGTEGGQTEAGERRMVKIGSNQMVALHGQDRTKKAIKEGTAILVQCINCQNWMQVTNTATLMFCPVCQVVSPVIQQNEVLTKEEAIQLTMDRKLAEKLQQEAYDREDGAEGTGEPNENPGGFFSSLFGGGGEAAPATSAAAASASASSGAAQSDSWWNKISSVVSYGVADQERGELGVTRPPGAAAASQYPANRGRVAAVVDGASRPANEETRGLLSPVVVDGDANAVDLPSGRVAEQKPLFSCMMDSVSNAANAVFSAGDAEGNAQGEDSGSLLVTNAGRGVGDGTGDYSRVPDDE